ncbi:hypothetical protein A5640_07365 [Mycobacterium asiaticum]|uniref:Multidrug DMT transporter permease n=2 Tax=Mycobacterium asiaticum TaxID=1790 RepID=A0A1A3KTT0_MYCAS|nr:hypothetical protein A5640_07365 [Mycobacterium asiaticum]
MGYAAAMDWLTTHAVAIGAALLAALAAAVGIVVRQAALQGPALVREMSGAVISAVLRDRLWWSGTAAAVSGYVFQAVALAHGSLLLVQPLLVSSLLFVLPLSAWRCGSRVSVSEWAWALLLTAALAVFVLVGRPQEGDYRPATLTWALSIIGAALVVVFCVLVARRTTDRVRAMSLGGAVAVMLGMIAVLTKTCTHRFAVGGWHGLFSLPALYLLVLLAVGVTVLQQWAFQAGALQASVPVMLVGEPVVAVLLGVVVLGEQLSARGMGVVVLPAAVVAMVAATIALGRGEGAHTEEAAHSGRDPGESDSSPATGPALRR